MIAVFHQQYDLKEAVQTNGRSFLAYHLLNISVQSNPSTWPYHQNVLPGPTVTSVKKAAAVTVLDQTVQRVTMWTGHVIEAVNQDTRARRVTRVGGKGFLLSDTKPGQFVKDSNLLQLQVW